MNWLNERDEEYEYTDEIWLHIVKDIDMELLELEYFKELPSEKKKTHFNN